MSMHESLHAVDEGRTVGKEDALRQLSRDTHGFTPLRELSITSRNRTRGYRYQPSPMRLLERTLERLSLDPTEYTFIDLGSGKGRAVLLAAEHGFRRSIGVEFAAELHGIATRNLARLRDRHPAAAQKVELLHMDATELVPPPEPTVFFLFNPFDDVVLRSVLFNIRASLQEHPRPLYYVYLNPVHARVFTEAGVPAERLQLVRIGLRDMPELITPAISAMGPVRRVRHWLDRLRRADPRDEPPAPG
ncbi:class I SAM-dependent methyltransferase [Paraliomyxa miuraensis]|uniref:class I SAM-dependent methyltransferase n=1 Tax=Paraliomyxa miuraensis TaxID=376150 RepID=UPI002257CDC2|nr:hypothetical protein [Paraliomyxa miuraensis]MCX4243036.1 hypothetical protein [Paraliomyxa miuraensis]